jgi:hypothetical protein
MRSCLPITSRSLRSSFTLAVILPALLALLPAKKLVAVESGCLGDQIQGGEDGASPLVSREVFYFIIDRAIRTGEPPVVSGRSYRGPPVPF